MKSLFLKIYYRLFKPLIKDIFYVVFLILFKVCKRKLDYSAKIKKILLIIPPQNGLGDNIMFSYYIDNLLKEKDIKLYVVTPYYELWQTFDYPNLKIIASKRNTLSLYRVLTKLKETFDLALCPSPYVQHIFSLFFVKAKYKLCYEPIRLTKKFNSEKNLLKPLCNFEITNHELYFDLSKEFYGLLLGKLFEYIGLNGKAKKPSLKLKAEDTHKFETKNIFIFPYAKSIYRRIPKEIFFEIADKLKKCGYRIILLYDSEAKNYTYELYNEIKNIAEIRFTNSISETIFLLNNAYAVICSDTGFMHIALLSEVKKIVVFFTVVAFETRIPQFLFQEKQILPIRILNPDLKSIISQISAGYESFFEVYPGHITQEIIQKYQETIRNFIEVYKEDIVNQIKDFIIKEEL